jgi:hypothetical protein
MVTGPYINHINDSGAQARYQRVHPMVAGDSRSEMRRFSHKDSFVDKNNYLVQRHPAVELNEARIDHHLYLLAPQQFFHSGYQVSDSELLLGNSGL